MATATRIRSTFQPPAEDQVQTFYALSRGEATTGPAEPQSYASREHVEFINAEQTVAVVSGYSRGSYKIFVRTPLALTDYFAADADALTDEASYYATLRNNGLWFEVLPYAGTNKTEARKRAEVFLADLQDVSNPLAVSLDGKFAPALTIALTKVNTERDYRRDEARVHALTSLARQAGVDVNLLALAIKEDRLTWSTPQVAPQRVVVVVKETETGNLTERVVDEVTLATGEVPDLGRIVHEGGVPDYLLKQRAFHQRRSVEAILRERENVTKALKDVQARAERLLADLAKGETLTRGFFDTVSLADDVEKVQAAATAYSVEVSHADLPQGYLGALLRDDFADTEGGSSRWLASDVRVALTALSALNGSPEPKGYDY